MKSEEFRIGNYVIDLFGKSTGFDNYIVIVSDLSDRQEIRARNITGGHASIIREMIGGIPLTEEWLRKDRFVTMDYEIDYIEWGIQTEDDPNCERFHIIQDGSDKPFFFEYDLGFGDQRIEIKYIHQLQNLYFALTGKELKFNL